MTRTFPPECGKGSKTSYLPQVPDNSNGQDSEKCRLTAEAVLIVFTNQAFYLVSAVKWERLREVCKRREAFVGENALRSVVTRCMTYGGERVGEVFREEGTHCE